MSVGIYEQVRIDFKDAIANGRKFEKDTLGILMSDFSRKEVFENGVKTLSDAESLTAVNGLIKAEHERHGYALKINPQDKLDEEYIRILQRYVPAQVSEDELVAWIKENIDFTVTKIGPATGIVVKHFGVRTNGKVVSAILNKYFSGK